MLLFLIVQIIEHVPIALQLSGLTLQFQHFQTSKKTYRSLDSSCKWLELKVSFFVEVDSTGPMK